MNKKRFTEIKNLLYVQRKKDSIKNDYGKALLIGGSLSYPGALEIASLLASVSGDGYTALSAPKDILPVIQQRAPITQIYEKMKDLSPAVFARYDSILFGNGIALTDKNRELLSLLLSSYSGKLVLDASALTLLSEDASLLSVSKAMVILTPHLGEARSLLKVSTKSRDPQRYEKEAKAFAREYHVYLLLKSSSSLLLTPEGKSYRSDYLPTPALAKAGSGDGLAGYLTGILAYLPKTVSAAEGILFADQMIHEAALRASERLTPGIASILDVPEEIRKIAEENRN